MSVTLEKAIDMLTGKEDIDTYKLFASDEELETDENINSIEDYIEDNYDET